MKIVTPEQTIWPDGWEKYNHAHTCVASGEKFIATTLCWSESVNHYVRGKEATIVFVPGSGWRLDSNKYSEEEEFSDLPWFNSLHEAIVYLELVAATEPA